MEGCHLSGTQNTRIYSFNIIHRGIIFLSPKNYFFIMSCHITKRFYPDYDILHFFLAVAICWVFDICYIFTLKHNVYYYSKFSRYFIPLAFLKRSIFITIKIIIKDCLTFANKRSFSTHLAHTNNL